MSKKNVVIYTDGACSGNPGVGGWGAVLIYGQSVKEIYGGDKSTTNNQMELTAAIMALKQLKFACAVTLYTDSQYVKKGITEWIDGWSKNDWKNSQKKPVKNKELWIELSEEAKRHEIQWKWVKGHDGDEMNEKADELARKGAEEVKNERFL